jgi:hypothetical protein
VCTSTSLFPCDQCRTRPHVCLIQDAVSLSRPNSPPSETGLHRIFPELGFLTWRPDLVITCDGVLRTSFPWQSIRYSVLGRDHKPLLSQRTWLDVEIHGNMDLLGCIYIGKVGKVSSGHLPDLEAPNHLTLDRYRCTSTPAISNRVMRKPPGRPWEGSASSHLPLG